MLMIEFYKIVMITWCYGYYLVMNELQLLYRNKKYCKMLHVIVWAGKRWVYKMCWFIFSLNSLIKWYYMNFAKHNTNYSSSYRQTLSLSINNGKVFKQSVEKKTLTSCTRNWRMQQSVISFKEKSYWCKLNRSSCWFRVRNSNFRLWC